MSNQPVSEKYTTQFLTQYLKLRGSDSTTFQERVFGGVPVSVDEEIEQGCRRLRDDGRRMGMEELLWDSKDPHE